MIGKNRSKYCLLAYLLCALCVPHAFAAPKRSTPSKIRVPSAPPAAEAPAHARTTNTPVNKLVKQQSAKRSTLSKVAVTNQAMVVLEHAEQSAQAESVQIEAPRPAVQEPVTVVAQAQQTNNHRRPTSSKTPVNPLAQVPASASERMAEADEQKSANEELAVALLPIDPSSAADDVSAQNIPGGQHIAVSKKIKPYKEGAEIYVVDTPIPSGNEFDIDLLYEQLGEDIVVVDSEEDNAQPQTRHEKALSAHLSTPSKTPASALKKYEQKSAQKDFDVQASAALIVNQETGEVIYSKGASDVMPIASISKLMTAMVVLDAKQSLNEKITITADDIDTLKKTSSRLSVGTKLTRRELLHLALMSSENRAAHALARKYQGGEKAFVKAMNAKAKKLGLTQTSYVEPTGLSPKNRSSARDLVWLVKAADKYPLIKQYSTANSKKLTIGKNKLSYKNSNKLIGNSNWNIGLQKTGYIREAGYCMVAQTSIANKRYIMVFLNANAHSDRIDDAEKIRAMIKQQNAQYASSGSKK